LYKSSFGVARSKAVAKLAIVLGGESRRRVDVPGLRVLVLDTTERMSESRSRFEREVLVSLSLRRRRPSSSSFFADEPPSFLPVNLLHMSAVSGEQEGRGWVGSLSSSWAAMAQMNWQSMSGIS